MKPRNPGRDPNPRKDAPGDEDLFDQAVSDVKRLHHKLAVTKPTRNSSAPARSASSEVPAEFGEELRFVRPGIQNSALQKLRRGQFPIEATLDLHGLTAIEATLHVQRFLQQSQMSGRAAVRIVHGKGYGSSGRLPVLKTKVRQLLHEFP